MEMAVFCLFPSKFYILHSAIYKYRGNSTFVGSSLQIGLFFAKQTQFPKKSNERK